MPTNVTTIKILRDKHDSRKDHSSSLCLPTIVDTVDTIFGEHIIISLLLEKIILTLQHTDICASYYIYKK